MTRELQRVALENQIKKHFGRGKSRLKYYAQIIKYMECGTLREKELSNGKASNQS